ncbi:MAG: 30S ribosomal protein S4 [Oscillospiraceae bacterium]|jgi:small subunit ribosomal protein S4|nr:30S ribosomal protein S4 [Oscillospiraceae bacterium]
MARYTEAVCKLCRREGQKLFLKGDRCYTGKCSIERRAYAPGQHGAARKKTTEYSTQLRAKQTARRYYGLSESQFHKYYEMAARKTGVTGEQLLRICESRLDNVVYLLGFGSSRSEARQIVNHGHILLNGIKTDIPSVLLKAGDVVSVKDTSRTNEQFKKIIEEAAKKSVPAWLEFSRDKMEGRVLSLPERDQIGAPVEEHLIVEFYSK